MKEWTTKLATGENLAPAEAEAAASALTSDAPADEKAAFLRALASKGETPEEVTAFARVFRALALSPGLDDLANDAIDVVGTGGDHSGTFNFSTAAALFLASAGVPVMKHGNRSITSRSGSADLLAALGVELDAPPEKLRESLERFSFCFFFAPSFHPAFKSIMPVRKQLASEGLRTIFNILGPLVNPGAPAYQVLGVYHHSWVAPLAKSLENLPLRGAAVVHSRIHEQRGIDELSTVGRNLLSGVGLAQDLRPPRTEALGLAPAPLEAIRGGDQAKNLTLLREVASGRAPRAIRETFSLNAAAGLLVTGRRADWQEALAAVTEHLATGRFEAWLRRFEDFNHTQ